MNSTHHPPRLPAYKADLVLLIISVFWGTTFILSKILLAEISLLYYLAVRLSLAALFLWFFAQRYHKELDSKTLTHGIILGLFLFLSYLFQMWGIRQTSASNAGFITGINVILVPIFSTLFFKERLSLATFVGVVLATVGLYFLSGGDYQTLNQGDWLVLVCSVAVAFHVILTSRFAPQHNIYLLTAIQLTVVAILSSILFLFSTEPLAAVSGKSVLIIFYLAIFGTVLTFSLQTAMQRFTTATHTALVFTTEPVFAAFFAFLIAGERLTVYGWFGGFLILLGMIVAEINWTPLFNKIKREKK